IVRLLFWPGVQNPHYGPSVLPSTHGPTVGAVVTLLVLAAAVIMTGWLATRPERRDARPLTAPLWILIAFLPAANLLVPAGQILAERTLYVSSVGAALLVAWSVHKLLRFRVPAPRVVA